MLLKSGVPSQQIDPCLNPGLCGVCMFSQCLPSRCEYGSEWGSCGLVVATQRSQIHIHLQ